MGIEILQGRDNSGKDFLGATTGESSFYQLTLAFLY